MILKFPDLNTLRLVLTSGLVPAAVAQAGVVAGADEQGCLWVQASASLARGVQAELRRLDVASAREMAKVETTAFASWLELVPLQPDPRPLERPEQLPVLFELSDGGDLARIVFEVLRLGNDRQAFRWLGNDEGETRALLRVVGPPYYSLLRAIDRAGQASAPVAYVERAANVWVELGQTHPLLELVKPPPGKLLFLRAPRHWTLLDDAPFRDIYEVMEFALPDRPAAWQDKPLAAKINVALSLRTGGPLVGTQMWVLRDDAEAELNRFVQSADDRLLTSLAFAVGEQDGHKTIVLRALHSKHAPPELVLNATPYRPHLRLPNLFLPVGTQLHPHLRRDVVRKLLADDTEHVVWLVPGAGGAFAPHRLPENAFRPLTDWVAYVLDRAAEPLQAWMQAMKFDFESFVCDEDAANRPKKPDVPKEKKRKERRETGDEAATGGPAIDYSDRTKVALPVPEVGSASDFAGAEPNVLQQQLRSAEDRFLGLYGDLDVPERRALWPELANLNAALRATDDAGLCWLAALWFENTVPATWADAWLKVEAAATGRELALDAVLSLPDPTTADLRALTAYVVWAAVQVEPPQSLLDRLNPVQRFLELHERLLPVRAVWLAWTHLVRLSHGDVLALVRARDRLLERLYHGGLRPETDLPSFLRFSGQAVNQRYRGLRQWLTQLCELAHMWAEENGRVGEAKGGELPAPMKGYIDLLFAFGLARLGDHDRSRQLLGRAAANLTEQGPVHALLLKAFEYRIRRALAGKPHVGPLPDEQLQQLKKLDLEPDNLARYAVERMRYELRVLEPDLELNPYRHLPHKRDDLDKAVAELPDLEAGHEIAARVESLWQSTARGAKGDTARALILREALNLAPRVNEDFGRKLLERTLTVHDAWPRAKDEYELTLQAELIERAMFVAGHFDRPEYIQSLVERFKRLLEPQTGTEILAALTKVANKCFRGLRKLGLREEIDQLLTWIGDVMLSGHDFTKPEPKELADKPDLLRAMLQVAGGWYYFGRNAQAEPVLNAARGVLFQNSLRPAEQTALARAYVAALGQGPVEAARARLEDLFLHLRGVRDGFTTLKYYSRFQLEVIETVILAVTHDDFTLGANARRWLEDDEFLVRKRIHHDVRAALGNVIY